MQSIRTVYILSLIAVLFSASPSAAQICSSVAELEAVPIGSISQEAPVFAPLQWEMTLSEARRALIADGWSLQQSGERVAMFEGELFGHFSGVAVEVGLDGHLMHTSVVISQASNGEWNEDIWDEVRSVLGAGYGPPAEERRSARSTASCSSFEPDGGSRVFARWSTIEAKITPGCSVAISYKGPGFPQEQRASELATARDADRKCREDAAQLDRDRSRLSRDRTRLAPLDPTVARLPLPPPPTPPGLDFILEFSEVAPEIIGGAERLRLGYPAGARREAGAQRVWVRLVVGADGLPYRVSVDRYRSVSPEIARAAGEAVQHLRFYPGKQNGQAVAVALQLPVTFRP